MQSRNTGGNDNEEDAMFTKKPLGGMSCASCEKNIINLHGIKADYTPWNRFPFRDPSERIARVSNRYSNKVLGRARLLKDALNDQPRLND